MYYLFDSLSTVVLTLTNDETQIVFHTFTVTRAEKYTQHKVSLPNAGVTLTV